eukprot:scaffold268594_cov26-Tisochrysis_lutea.AAC.1
MSLWCACGAPSRHLPHARCNVQLVGIGPEAPEGCQQLRTVFIALVVWAAGLDFLGFWTAACLKPQERTE